MRHYQKVSYLAKLLTRSERSIYYWVQNKRTPRFTLGEIKKILKSLDLKSLEEFPETIQEILDLISEKD